MIPRLIVNQINQSVVAADDLAEGNVVPMIYWASDGDAFALGMIFLTLKLIVPKF